MSIAFVVDIRSGAEETGVREVSSGKGKSVKKCRKTKKGFFYLHFLASVVVGMRFFLKKNLQFSN